MAACAGAGEVQAAGGVKKLTRQEPPDGQDQGSFGHAAMYGRGSKPAPPGSVGHRGTRQRETDQQGYGGSPEANAGWTIFTYLLAGMAAYGLIGWLVGRVTHIAALFPVGMVVGLALAIVLIIVKYGRP